MNRRRLLAVLAMAVGASVLLPQAALAHLLVGRQDLPIPKWLFGWAATVVLVASFVGLAALWPKPRLEQVPERKIASVPTILDPICGAVGLAIFVLIIYAGYDGSQTATNNISEVVIFI